MLSGIALVFFHLNFMHQSHFLKILLTSFSGYAGDSVICGKMSGEIQICDLRTSVCQIKWHMLAKHAIRSIALEQDHLLTW